VGSGTRGAGTGVLDPPKGRNKGTPRQRSEAQGTLKPTLGPIVCDWIETYLVHGPGDIQGTPIVIDDEYRAFIWRAYEVYPKTHSEAGRRVFSRAFLSRPKGRAKSELAGMVACAELLGPVRFDGWDARGNPVGAPIVAPEILCVATEANQAGNTFDNVVYMLQEGDVYEEYPGLDVGMSRVFYAPGGSIEPITAAARSKDGGKSSFVVADETHLWVEPRLQRLHATITRNITKRRIANGWMLETSTMYAPGEESVAEETHKTSKSNPSVLFDHREAPADTDINDDDSLREALRHVYGVAAEWTNIEGIIQDEFRNPQKRESDNRRYWLNQPVTLEERFVTPEQWDDIEDSKRSIPDGSRVVLAFDGSKSNDSTALTVVLIDDVPHVDVVDCWEKPESAPHGWEVDILAVETSIREACKKWRVQEIAADTYLWARSLQVLADEGLPAVAFPQSAVRMTPATKRLYDLIVTKGVTQSGDERLRRHMLNACVKDDHNRGYRLAKEDPNSERKIDLAVTTVMGVDRAATFAVDMSPGVYDLNEIAERLRREDAEKAAAERADTSSNDLTSTPAPVTEPNPGGGQVFIRLEDMPPRG
jgi:phage terminase large subunit-like protein